MQLIKLYLLEHKSQFSCKCCVTESAGISCSSNECELKAVVGSVCDFAQVRMKLL